MGLSLSKTAKVDQTSSAKRISEGTSLGKQEQLNWRLVSQEQKSSKRHYLQTCDGWKRQG